MPEYMVTADTAYRLVTDHLGTVRQIVNSPTGAIKQEIAYDEFGNVLSDTNPGFSPFGFAGGLYDVTTKLSRYRTRDYESGTGRWTNKDPIRFEGSETNLYLYVQDEPINSIDPNGTSSSNSAELALAGGSARAAASFGQVLASAWGSDILGLIFAQAAISIATTEIIRNSLSNNWLSGGEGEPASEDYVKAIAKKIAKDLGSDAAEKFHDAKERGAPDRTKEEVREQAKELYDRLGKKPPKWIVPR